MTNYSNVIQTGVSIVLLMLLGFFTCKFKFIEVKTVSLCNKFLLNVGYPAMIIKALATANIKSVSFTPYLICTCSIITMAIILTLIFLIPFKDRAKWYISTFITTCYINYLIIGIPVFSAIWDESESWIVTIMNLSNDTIFTPIYLVVINIYFIKQANIKHREMGDGKEEKFSYKTILQILRRIFLNPIVLANIVGFIYSATGWGMCLFLRTFLEKLTGVVLGLAMFCVGGFLSQRSLIACSWYHFAFCVIVRHILFPITVGLYAYAFGQSNHRIRQNIVLSCMPSATASFVLSEQFGVGAGVGSTMVLWTTVLCVPFVILWLWVLDQLHLFVE